MGLNKYLPMIIFLLTLFLYSLFNYGGIRSPDSEIVFRTTQSLVSCQEFAVPKPINWSYFGLGLGTDNKRYSIFGPAESVLAIPLLEFANYLKHNKLIPDTNKIPLSFHIVSNNKDAGLYYIEGKRPPEIEGHYVRFVVSFFNSIIGALTAVFLFYTLFIFSESRYLSFLVTFIYSFGSLIFPYTGTFFSEPLCAMFMILSFLYIAKNEKTQPEQRLIKTYYFFSGLFLGLAITAHISAVLSVPFYYMFLLGSKLNKKLNSKRLTIFSFYFTIGLSIFVIMLLYYNYIRFGNVFETGRFADHLYHYAIYVNLYCFR